MGPRAGLRKILPLAGIRSPARSESLYQLSYSTRYKRYISEERFRTDPMEAHFVYSCNFMLCTHLFWGVFVGTVGRGTVLQAGRTRVRFPMESLGFFIDLILPAAV
jgi:hypothetical protein